MKKLNLVLFAFLFTLSSCKQDIDLPEGMELVGNADKIHFVYAPETYKGEEINLREAGRVICTVRFQQQDYCQIYFWYNIKDVATSLPVINRASLFAIYELRDGIMNLKQTKESK